MAFRFVLKPNNPATTTWRERTATLEYFASGTTDRDFVESYALQATPQMYGNLWRQDVQISATATDMWNVVVPYGQRPLPGSYELLYDTTGGTVHVIASRSTAGAYGTRMDGSAAATTDFAGMIGVNQESVEGVDIVVPALKLTVNFQHELGVMTLPRIKQLARNSGKVNTDVFLTFQPGEVLFLGCAGKEGLLTPTTVSYQFACSENATGLSIGSVANIAKKGWEYLWVRWQDQIVAQTPVKKPKAVYVEKVYAETSFVQLFGFGA